MAKLEIACFNAESALVAQQAGADRIELCEGYSVGGVTPAYGLLEQLRPKLHIPVFVMIRPRGGDFVYSDLEFEQMKSSITKFSPLADGFVFGVLEAGGTVDKGRNKTLVQLATSKPCTFHRAFDSVRDFDQSLEDVVDCGFGSLLTSGGAGNALGGSKTIAGLIRQARGRLTVMPGGSVRSTNIEELHTSVSASFYHSASITSNSDIADPVEVESLKSKLGSKSSNI